jgi:DNA-directed RNA polymerase specialized sigma24 family protein
VDHRTAQESRNTQVSAVFAANYDRIVRIARRSLRPADAHLAEDFTQDAFVVLIQWLERGNKLDRPVGFLATVVRRLVCAHYRRSSTRNECPVDIVAALERWLRTAASPSAEDEVEALETLRELVAA